MTNEIETDKQKCQRRTDLVDLCGEWAVSFLQRYNSKEGIEILKLLKSMGTVRPEFANKTGVALFSEPSRVCSIPAYSLNVSSNGITASNPLDKAELGSGVFVLRSDYIEPTGFRTYGITTDRVIQLGEKIIRVDLGETIVGRINEELGQLNNILLPFETYRNFFEKTIRKKGEDTLKYLAAYQDDAP